MGNCSCKSRFNFLQFLDLLEFLFMSATNFQLPIVLVLTCGFTDGFVVVVPAVVFVSS
jgi:hypothetical protein